MLSASTSASNAKGRSSATVTTRNTFPPTTSQTGRSLPNSARICLHAPQGVPATGPSVATAMAFQRFHPLLTAPTTAAASAQMHSGYDAF